MIRSFGKDIIIYGLSSSLSRFVGLFLLPLYTRFFTPDDYGTMDLIATIVAICSIFGMMQLESAVSRYFYAEKNNKARNSMVSTAMWTIVGFSTMIFIALVLSANLLSNYFFESGEFNIVIIVAAMTIPVANLNSLFTVLIRFKKKAVHYLLFQITQLVFTVSLTVLLIVWINTGIIGVFWGKLFGFLITSLGMSYYLRSNLNFTWRFNDIKKMFRYSLPLVPSVAGNWANNYVNRFVMYGYLSVADIGIYVVALKVASIFNLIGSAFRMAWAPFFWETYEKESNHRQIFRSIQNHVSILTLGLVVIVTLFSYEIIYYFATPEYLGAAKLVGLIALSIAITSIISQVIGLGPGITKKTEYNTIIYFLSLSVNIGSLFIFVPIYGLIGVPLSLLLSSLTMLTVSWYNSEKLYPVGFDKSSMIIHLTIVLIVIAVEIKYELLIEIKMLLTSMVLMYFYFRYQIIIKKYMQIIRSYIKK